MHTKEKLVESAKSLLIDKGFHEMTVDDIVNNSGVVKVTFYTHFNSKTELIGYFASFILDEMVNEMKKLDVKSNINDNLKNIIEVFFEYNRKNREIVEALYHSFAGSGNLKEWELLYNNLYELILDLLFKEKSSATYLKVQTIVGMIEHAAEQSYIFVKESDHDIVKRKEVVYKMLVKIFED